MKNETSNNFLSHLRDRVESIAKEESLDTSNYENRGYAFSIFVAEMFMQWDVALEEDIAEVVSRGPNDKQIDIILQDAGAKIIYLIQAKCKGLSNKPKPMDPEPALAFLTTHDSILDVDNIKNANNFIKDNLLDYKSQLDKGWKSRLYYVTTEKARNQDILNKFKLKNEDLSKGPYDTEFELFDTSELQEIHTEILAYKESIPEKIEIDIPQKLFIENKQAKYPFIVGVLKGNSIRNEYLKKGRKDSLFAWNIRKYLGDRGINKTIKQTAEEHPEHFFYFNNGITAVCEDYKLNGNKITIYKFQIINGAQTVASIAKAQAKDNVLVLFRLIKTKKVDTESGINRDIIQFNNTQNSIRLSDFRSNDSIHKYLESEFKSFRKTEILGQLTYQAKRTGKKGRGRVIKMEELAKIRYAYLHEPYTPNSEPKSLWTLNSDQGHYSEAFGVDGNVESYWSKKVLEESIFAIALHDVAVESAKKEKELDDQNQFFHRLRFHAIALAGIYFRTTDYDHSIHTMLGSKEKFTKFWDCVWNEARTQLRVTHKDKCRNINHPISLHALVRSEQIWENLVDNFCFSLKIKSPYSESVDRT